MEEISNTLLYKELSKVPRIHTVPKISPQQTNKQKQ